MAISVTSTTDTKENVAAANAETKPADTVVEKSAATTEAKADVAAETTEDSETSDTDLEEAAAETQDGSDEDGNPSDDEAKPTKKKGGFKKKIDKLTKNLSAKEQEAEYWKAEALKNAKNSGDAKPVEKSTKVEADSKPKADNFDTHEEYIEALTDWKLEQRETEKVRKAKETEVMTQFQAKVTAFQKKVSEFAESVDDYEDTISDVDDVAMSFGFQNAISSSDNGPQIIYELAKNRKEYERINGLEPMAAAREIWKIETRIAGDAAKNGNTAEVKQSKAPPPIKPVGSSGAGSVKKSIYDSSLSQKEYERVRREQIAARET